jgi:hypothetical protein
MFGVLEKACNIENESAWYPFIHNIRSFPIVQTFFEAWRISANFRDDRSAHRTEASKLPDTEMR